MLPGIPMGLWGGIEDCTLSDQLKTLLRDEATAGSSDDDDSMDS